MKYAARISKLPPYLFAEIDRKTKEAIQKGVDVISLGVGDPDRPTPSHIVSAAQGALGLPVHHRYPFGGGQFSFRKAIAAWYAARFGVALDPSTEIHSLIGSKDGLSHLAFAYVNPGDVTLVPDPGYPVYRNSTLLAGGVPYRMPLREEIGFLPVLSKVPRSALRKARILYLNYPNNPTAAVAPRAFLEEAVRFAKRHKLVLVYDNAYSEMYFKEPPLSIFQISGSRDVALEFHSCSKTFNMTGWRVGWACGTPELLRGLAKVKDNMDSGVFQAVQEGAIAALTSSQACVEEMRTLYRQRRDVFVEGLKEAGWDVQKPMATFYVWARTPKGWSSTQMVERLLMEAHVVATPGCGFGAAGEGYVRFALTVEESRLRQAVDRIAKLKW